MARFSAAQKRSQAYLRGIRLAERRIQILEAEIELQQSRLQLNGVSFGENVNQTMAGCAQEEGVVKLYKFCEELDSELIGYVEERDEGLNVIGHLSDNAQYDVLYLRYFQGFTFGHVANILSMSESTVFRIHRMALSALHPYLPCQYR